MSFTYKKAGVDVNKGNLFIKNIIPIMKTANVKGAIGNIGGFGGLFKPDLSGYKEPILVSSTDGVGTKLKIAFAVNKHDTVGIDLVAMNVNDILCVGARPLFFLDYIATHSLNADIMTDVVKGIVDGCRQAGCALIGGETAQMPSMYKKGEYDLAGFCVGIVDKKDIIDNLKLKPGDRLVGIESSGLHSNGFSLARKVFNQKELGLYSKVLLAPTMIYVKPVLGLCAQVCVKAIAHITGGSYPNKVGRVLSKNLDAVIYKDSWIVPDIFKIIHSRGRISDEQMYKTFNMGVGMVAVVEKKDVDKSIQFLSRHGLKAWNIGQVVKGSGKVRII